MSLNFAAISPHPPIIVPEVGSRKDLIKVAETTVALRKLAHEFQIAEIDVLIVISPHGIVYPDRFSVSAMKKNFGTFAQFGAPNVTLEYENDMDLVGKIAETAQKNGINVYFDCGY